jgi:hypothetical protein
MKPNTHQLVDCIMLDIMPGLAAMVDFGMDSGTEVFGALQWALKHEQCTPEELDQALGDGPMLTEIVNRGSNPYACTIKTSWDDMSPEEE